MRPAAIAVAVAAWAGAAATACLLGACASPPPPPAPATPLSLPARLLAAAPVFFDDFSYPDVAALPGGGWTVRTAPGHPGVPGARWGDGGLSIQPDPDLPGNRLLRLSARTDGTPGGTQQVQLCHARKVLRGTYAARIRFADAPRAGADGDPVIQTFYAVGDLRFPYDPLFSEVDWEYLANGGWGSPATRLYAISWQTVRVEPWDAHNSPHEEMRSMAGWHQLTMQVEAPQVRMFVDGLPVATHAGRNVPVAPMAIAFNLWFSPAGLLPAGGAPREWDEDVDWVFHAPDRVLAPGEVAAQVAAWRREGVTRRDTVPVAVPALPSRCDM